MGNMQDWWRSWQQFGTYFFHDIAYSFKTHSFRPIFRGNLVKLQSFTNLIYIQGILNKRYMCSKSFRSKFLSMLLLSTLTASDLKDVTCLSSPCLRECLHGWKLAQSYSRWANYFAFILLHLDGPFIWYMVHVDLVRYLPLDMRIFKPFHDTWGPGAQERVQLANQAKQRRFIVFI